MRKTPKSDLNKIFTATESEPTANFTCVVDGGFLLHKLVWSHGKTYDEICTMYVQYVLKHFKANAWVIFDGYSKDLVGLKSYERYRRREKSLAPDVNMGGEKLTTLSQAKFFLNDSNKSKFIDLLKMRLEQEGIQVKVAKHDADYLIVNTAIGLQSLTEGKVAVVGNDVDLLVLLIGLTPDYTTMYFYKSNPGRTGDTLYSTDDHKDLKPFILFAHAFSGCDTTSCMYGKGEKKLSNC